MVGQGFARRMPARSNSAISPTGIDDVAGVAAANFDTRGGVWECWSRRAIHPIAADNKIRKTPKNRLVVVVGCIQVCPGRRRDQ